MKWFKIHIYRRAAVFTIFQQTFVSANELNWFLRLSACQYKHLVYSVFKGNEPENEQVPHVTNYKPKHGSTHSRQASMVCSNHTNNLKVFRSRKKIIKAFSSHAERFSSTQKISIWLLKASLGFRSLRREQKRRVWELWLEGYWLKQIRPRSSPVNKPFKKLYIRAIFGSFSLVKTLPTRSHVKETT